MTEQALSTWLAAYGHAWETNSADALVDIFAADGHYQDTPYSEPVSGHERIRAYWVDAVGQSRDVKFSYEILSVSADQGIAHWSAIFRRTKHAGMGKIDEFSCCNSTHKDCAPILENGGTHWNRKPRH
jgi:hypothetical protein